MNSTFFVIFAITCFGTSADWVTVEDFTPSELANLTLEKEHKLMLQKLLKIDEVFLAGTFYYEILSKSIGNDFFGFSQSENANINSNAIIKAMFECLKKLVIQDRVEESLVKVSINGPRYVKTAGSFSVAFSLVSSDIDFFLKNETLYTTLRDKYKKERYSSPNKVYHYGIAKSSKDETKAAEELFNDPKMKPLMAHLAWVWIKYSYDSKLKDTKNVIMNLAKTADISDEIQQIYERLITKSTLLIKHIDFYILNLPETKSEYFHYLQVLLTEGMWSKINEDIPDWQDYLECDLSVTEEEHSNQKGTSRCGRKHIVSQQDTIYKDVWPVTSDFDRPDLRIMTQEQQHKLFLDKLVNKNSSQIYKLLFVELMAKSIGNDFFGYTSDEKSNIQNNAVIKAVFECIPNLLLQARARTTIDLAVRNASEYIAKTGSIEMGFNELCSNIDDMMKNVTFYKSRRDAYTKQKLSKPKKTYQYSIGKPTEDQHKIISELFNDPLIKIYWAHEIWMKINFTTATNVEEAKTKYSVLELAKVPSKSEVLQKIYEQTIREGVPLIKNFTSDQIYVGASTAEPILVIPKSTELFQFRTFLVTRMKEKISKNPDLINIFNTLQTFFGHKSDKTYAYQL